MANREESKKRTQERKPDERARSTLAASPGSAKMVKKPAKPKTDPAELVSLLEQVAERSARVYVKKGPAKRKVGYVELPPKHGRGKTPHAAPKDSHGYVKAPAASKVAPKEEVIKSVRSALIASPPSMKGSRSVGKVVKEGAKSTKSTAATAKSAHSDGSSSGSDDTDYSSCAMPEGYTQRAPKLNVNPDYFPISDKDSEKSALKSAGVCKLPPDGLHIPDGKKRLGKKKKKKKKKGRKNRTSSPSKRGLRKRPGEASPTPVLVQPRRSMNRVIFISLIVFVSIIVVAIIIISVYFGAIRK